MQLLHSRNLRLVLEKIHKRSMTSDMMKRPRGRAEKGDGKRRSKVGTEGGRREGRRERGGVKKGLIDRNRGNSNSSI